MGPAPRPPGFIALGHQTVRFTRLIDMINRLTASQINGTLQQALKLYAKPSLLLLDELGYLPIDKRGADLRRQCRRIVASSVSHPLDQP